MVDEKNKRVGLDGIKRDWAHPAAEALLEAVGDAAQWADL
jgi:hypothetical protein